MSWFVIWQRGHIFNHRCSVNCYGLCSYWRSSIRSKNNLQIDISSTDWVTDLRKITCAIQENATLLHHKKKEKQETNKSPTGRRDISKVDDERRREEVEWLCQVPTNYQRCPCDVPEKSKDSVSSQQTTNVVRTMDIDGRRSLTHLPFEGLSIICQSTWRVYKK